MNRKYSLSAEFSNGSYTVQDESDSDGKKKKGLTLWTSTFFIIGGMAGSGVLALPNALSGAGWIGVVLIIVCCLNSLYSGICLGRCWLILEERWEEYRGKIRYPYPAIASRAVGPKMRYVVSACVDFTLLGVATVYLLLSAQLIHSLAVEVSGVSFCYWVLVVAAVLWPATWFGSPEEFWPAAVGAILTTALACLLLFIAILTDHREEISSPKYPVADFTSFFLALSTIIFSFGGAAQFPTFQNDMRDKKQFPYSASLAYAGLLILYLPIAISGYKTYGSLLGSNVLDSVQPGGLKTAVEVLLVGHLVCAFLIAINPPSQELEEFLKIPKSFGWKRCALRTSIMAIAVFIAESIPHFGKILNLIGGSTVTLMTFVFPPLFYMLLCRQQNPNWPKRVLPLHVIVYLVEIMAIGILGGIVSTYSAIKDIFGPSSFTPPCYVNLTAAST